MKAAEIRQRFLNYFAGHDHTIVPSSNLVPGNDPTLYFVNAGMVQFKDVFTGKDQRDYSRATTVQKCLRVSGKHNDLENVGRTPRHHTLFEMLGNFSFGDYFKSEAIPMAWELLTGDLGIDARRLWVTVFEEDDEAYDFWRGSVGVSADRIQRLGAKDNFWSMGETGPCGPCSELHFDHGPSVSSDERGPAGESDRYVEIWNLVFMQYEQHGDGTRTNLPRPSIDTGAGLERIAAIKQGVYSNYDTDLFQGLIRRASSVSGVGYNAAADSDVALRVIADHSRATAFLVADGVMPSNEGRGYVLRRVMRRAIRFGVKLGIERPFFHEVTEQVVREFQAAYPELGERESFIEEVVRGEEERFRRTLDRGMRLLDTELARAGRGGTVPGDVAFTLSDTYGFPLDLTRLIAEEHEVGVDEPGFDQALEAQRARGRAAWKGTGAEAVAALWYQLAQEHGETRFTGYDRDEDLGTVVSLVKQTRDADGEIQSEAVERLEAGDDGIVLLDRTPFYAESGGQVGDTGGLASERARFDVRDTSLAEGLRLHQGVLIHGAIAVGDTVSATVDADSRNRTRRNHTGTHLLHAALRNVLGDHVAQKGSLVGPNRLRFDFSHHKAMTSDEVRAVEREVNAAILDNQPVNTTVEDLESAKAAGAMALFGEKYAADVRVVTVPGYSVELCGGTHCARTGDIGLLKITSEGGIAAGVRRIEGQTGSGALAWVVERETALNEAATLLKQPADKVADGIRKLQEERKALEKELEEARRELAKDAAASLVDAAREIGGIKILAAEFDGDLKEQADRLRNQLGSSLVVLGSAKDGRVTLVAATTKDLAGKRIHAGNVIKEIAPLVGGGGGGRPDMAQAGGKDPAGLPMALERVYTLAEELLG